jgi:signal recognition particle subunit SRP54
MMQQIQKMGPLSGLLKMIPGLNQKALKGVKVDDKQMKHVEAIILSMTAKERHKPEILNGSRRQRIAKGSGRTVQEVNRLMDQFKQMQKMMKQMRGMGMFKPGMKLPGM